MLKQFNFEEEPIVKINWWKIRYKTWQITEKILKIATKAIISTIRAFLWLRKKIIRFCISKIKGYWFLLLLIILFLFSIVFIIKAVELNKKQQEIKELKQINKQQIKNTEDFIKENKNLKDKIKDLEKKASIKKQTIIASASYSTGWAKVGVLTDNVKQVIAKYSSTYGVDKDLVECIVANESSGRSDAVGDNGAAIGLAQYHLATFLGHRKQMGLSQEDLRTDIEASIQAMCWSISNSGIGNWTARWKCT